MKLLRALLGVALFTPAVALSALGTKPAPAAPKPAASQVLVQEATPSCGESAAEAAKRGDFAAVRGSCKECHASHRAAYRREHRADALH